MPYHPQMASWFSKYSMDTKPEKEEEKKKTVRQIINHPNGFTVHNITPHHAPSSTTRQARKRWSIQPHSRMRLP